MKWWFCMVLLLDWVSDFRLLLLCVLCCWIRWGLDVIIGILIFNVFFWVLKRLLFKFVLLVKCGFLGEYVFVVLRFCIDEEGKVLIWIFNKF